MEQAGVDEVADAAEDIQRPYGLNALIRGAFEPNRREVRL